MFRRFVSSVVSFVAAAAVVIPALTGNAFAGSKMGPQSQSTQVEAHKSDTYRLTLVGGEETKILVTGDGDTDLDCYLMDENDNVVAHDTDTTDTCLLTMTPKWTGSFHVEVRNMGGVYNRYTIRTN